MLCESKRHIFELAFLVALLLSAIAGCGPSSPKLVRAVGKVTLDGKPLSQGMVTFQPTDWGSTSGQRQAIGAIQSDGSYALTTFQPGDGIMPGEYFVAIDNRQASIDLGLNKAASSSALISVPIKYAVPTTSGLTATIPREVRQLEFNFALTRQ